MKSKKILREKYLLRHREGGGGGGVHVHQAPEHLHKHRKLNLKLLTIKIFRIECDLNYIKWFCISASLVFYSRRSVYLRVLFVHVDQMFRSAATIDN